MKLILEVGRFVLGGSVAVILFILSVPFLLIQVATALITVLSGFLGEMILEYAHIAIDFMVKGEDS